MFTAFESAPSGFVFTYCFYLLLLPIVLLQSVARLASMQSTTGKDCSKLACFEFHSLILKMCVVIIPRLY